MPAMTPHAASRFRLTRGVRSHQLPTLRLAIRLMMAEESLRTVSRSYLRIAESSRPADIADQWQQFFLMMSIVGELALALREEDARQQITRDFVAARCPSLATSYDDLMSNPPCQILKVAFHIRNKYVAHWDASRLDAFLEQLKNTPNAVPVLETDNNGRNDSTAYGWARAAMFADLSDTFGIADEAGFHDLLQRAAILSTGTVDLLGQLIGGLLTKNGLMEYFEELP